MKLISIIGASNTGYSTNASASQSLNLYPEVVGDGETRKVVSYGTPGLELLKDLTTIDALATPVRGVWSGAGKCIVAAGPKYFQIDSAGALVGSVHIIADDTDHTPVQFYSNGNQLLIISAGLAYIDGGTGPTQITFPAISGTVNTAGTVVTWVSGDTFDAGLYHTNVTINAVVYTVASVVSPTYMILTTSAGTQSGVAFGGEPVLTASSGAFLDGYFIVAHPDSKQINVSKLLDGSSWDALDYAIKEGYPDNIMRIVADHEELIILGAETMEIWRNTGGADFPFERDPGAFVHQGIIAPYACDSLGGALYYIGADSRGASVAYRMQGFMPQRISTHAVEDAWRSADMRHAESYGYIEDGHQFWVVVISTGAWVYDITTGLWHERAYWTGSAFARPKARCHTFIPEWGTAGQHIVGAWDSGKVYRMGLDLFSDAGSDIKRVRACGHITNEQRFNYHRRLQLDMETGTVASGDEPVVSLDWSDDGGHTFNTPRTAGFGLHNDFAKRVVWRGLGKSRDRVYRFSITGQSKVAIVDAYLEMELGGI